MLSCRTESEAVLRSGKHHLSLVIIVGLFRFFHKSTNCFDSCVILLQYVCQEYEVCVNVANAIGGGVRELTTIMSISLSPQLIWRVTKDSQMLFHILHKPDMNGFGTN